MRAGRFCNSRAMTEPAPPPPPPTPPAPEDRLVKTYHSAVVGGRELAYTVTTGTIVLREESREEEGRRRGRVGGREAARRGVLHRLHARTACENRGDRPVTFAFNGGPGSSSVWLHLGAARAAARRRWTTMGITPPPPYGSSTTSTRCSTSPTWCSSTRSSTGYSRAVAGEKAKQFHGFQQDIESVGEFIRLYTTRYRRWASPKFLAGESYGTTRAAGARRLPAGAPRHVPQRPHAGLVGPQLPDRSASTTATTCRTSLLPADLHRHRLVPQAARARPAGATCAPRVAEAEALRASSEYALGADAGATRLPDERARTIVAQLARYTGLSEDYVERTNLRIDDPAASSRSCCATSGAPSAGSTAASRASTATPPASTPEYDPSFGRHPRRRTPPRSTTTCAASSASRATCPTRSSPSRLRARGATPTTRTATSTWPRRCARR